MEKPNLMVGGILVPPLQKLLIDKGIITLEEILSYEESFIELMSQWKTLPKKD